MGATLFDKIWQSHAISTSDTGETLLYLDRLAMHERTGTIAMNSLAARGLTPRLPQNTICVMDHIVDTRPGRSDESLVPGGEVFITSTRSIARQFGLRIFDVNDADQGISHLVSAEQGFALPGATLACADSHTCTLGALGALAIGIGTSQTEHALATRTLSLLKPGNMRVTFNGEAKPGVYAKDLILFLIARHGVAAAGRRAVEFAGKAINQLDMAGRMTLCNMAVEFSAFTGIIAPDQVTLDYVAGRPNAPARLPAEHWQALHSDADATFDAELTIDVDEIQPRITWGTSPEHGMAVTERVPTADTPETERALAYAGLSAGQPISDVAIDAAYIGSCTNARIEDLRVAADVVKGRTVAPGVRALCVPGSKQVKAAAEAEGLDKVFTTAGFEWREPGCGMCFYAGGEHLGEGARIVSTTNRNFEGRQGPSIRTHLASPATVAASAIRGKCSTVEMLGP